MHVISKNIDIPLDRTQQVIISGHSSSHSHITPGVPKRSVLGPLLFICYINDLPEEVKLSLKLYADDVLLLQNNKLYK